MDPRSTLRRLLWHDAEARSRAPVRLVAGLVGFLLLFLLTFLILEAMGVVPGSWIDSLVGLSLLSTVIVAGGLVPIARFVDRRQYADYGLHLDRNWWLDCAFGLGLGAALQTGIYAVGWAAGWYVPLGTFVAERSAAGSFLTVFVAVIVAFLAVGIYEELLVRGWLLTNLAEGFRFGGERAAVAIAVLLSSGIFGLLHAINPGAGVLSTVTISLAGVFLALGYVLTGELAIPIGVHVTWNLFQGGVYGLGVSGLTVPATLVDTQVVGPELATGGSFGPEAGVLGLLAVVAGSAAIVGWVQWRTGVIRIHPAVTTPSLRDGDSEEP